MGSLLQTGAINWSHNEYWFAVDKIVTYYVIKYHIFINKIELNNASMDRDFFCLFLLRLRVLSYTTKNRHELQRDVSFNWSKEYVLSYTAQYRHCYRSYSLWLKS